MSWVDATSASLPDGTVVTVAGEAASVAVARAGGVWYAVDLWCTHAECPLSDGWVEEGAIRCACHGALFDLASGDVLDGPALEPVGTHPTRILDGRVEVELS